MTRHASALLLLIVILFLGSRSGVLQFNIDPYAIYSSETKKTLDFELSDDSDRIKWESNPFETDTRPRSHYVAVADINTDGYQDFAIISAKKKLTIFNNNDGNNFTALSSFVSVDPITTVSFFDYDNDGLSDLLYTTKKNTFISRNINGYINLSNLPIKIMKNPSSPVAVNIFDFNNDGYLDILLGFYDYPDGMPRMHRSKSKTESVLVMNQRGDSFRRSKIQGANGLTWSIGISDVDGDGWADAYFANDFGFDMLFTNFEGKNFEDSSYLLKSNNVSNDSMGADFGDIDNDGDLDLYVSNLTIPGRKRGYNRLWLNNTYTNRKLEFIDKGYDLGVDKCGFSWGAKFVDLNLDSYLDLAISNGLGGSLQPSDHEKVWYIRFMIKRHGPSFLRTLKNYPFKNLEVTKRQRKCIFIQDPITKKFLDVTAAAGITHRFISQGLALIDFNNDGFLDLLFDREKNSPVLIRNTYTGGNAWAGIELIENNRAAIGARIALRHPSSTQYKELFPGNGFSSQSDPRLVFGIGADIKIYSATVSWTNGTKELFNNIQINKYNTLLRGQGVKIK